MLPRFGVFISRLFPASEYPHDAAGRVELNDHIRTFVDGPDIIVFVDAYRVCEGPAVEALSNFTNEFALRTEFEQLRRSRCVSRSVGTVRAGKNENVAF